MSDFEIKDSGARQEFSGGMVRDTTEGKIDYSSVLYGPMYRRWAAHTTKGRTKYPDSFPGVPNWTLAEGVEEWLHARASYLRHSDAYLRGAVDEDHAAAMFFNVNFMEYVRAYVEGLGGTVPHVFEGKASAAIETRGCCGCYESGCRGCA